MPLSHASFVNLQQDSLEHSTPAEGPPLSPSNAVPLLQRPAMERTHDTRTAAAPERQRHTQII